MEIPRPDRQYLAHSLASYAMRVGWLQKTSPKVLHLLQGGHHLVDHIQKLKTKANAKAQTMPNEWE